MLVAARTIRSASGPHAMFFEEADDGHRPWPVSPNANFLGASRSIGRSRGGVSVG